MIIQTLQILPMQWLTAHPGITVTIVIVVAGLLALAIMSNFVLDTRPHRRRIAKRQGRLVSQMIENPHNVRAGKAIAHAIEGNYRFKQCCALEVLERAHFATSDEPWALELREICADTLYSADPFVRHSAARLFASMGPAAGYATKQLIDILSEHPYESAGRYAAVALGQIPPTGIEELDRRRREVLSQAIELKSVAAESAAIAYEAFTQKTEE